MGRPRTPRRVAPEPGGPPTRLQVCSLKLPEPIPGTRMVVLGGGLSPTDMPPTESPIRLVPCASDEDFPPPEELLACETITLANAVHTPFTGRAQTFCAFA